MNGKIIKMEFREKCRSFVYTAGSLLKTYLNGVVSKSEPESKYAGGPYHDNTDRAGTGYGPLSDYISACREQIRSLKEYETCLEIMRKDETILKHFDHRVGTLTFSTQRTAWEYLEFLLRGSLILDEYAQLHVNPKGFDSSYNQLESFFYSDFIAYDVYSLVYGFASDLDVIVLDDSLEIRKMKQNEIPAELLAAKYLFGSHPSDYVLKMRYRERKLFDQDLGVQPMVTEDDELGKLLVALRVFKDGSIAWGSRVILPVDEISQAASSSQTVLIHDLPPGFPYKLNKDEIASFRRFWSLFGRVDMESDPSYGIVVRRFNRGYERKRYDDKLIDFFIAFEALLTKEGEGYIKNNLAVRTSQLIGQNNDQRAQIEKQMKELYAIRSKVVHGKSKDPVAKYACQLQKLLRDSVKNLVIMLQNQTHEEIISRLSSS